MKENLKFIRNTEKIDLLDHCFKDLKTIKLGKAYDSYGNELPDTVKGIFIDESELKQYNDSLLIEMRKYSMIKTREIFVDFKEKNKIVDFNKELNLKTGDIISFLVDDNNFRLNYQEILGFTEDGKAYILWDCYWSPINLLYRQYELQIKSDKS